MNKVHLSEYWNSSLSNIIGELVWYNDQHDSTSIVTHARLQTQTQLLSITSTSFDPVKFTWLTALSRRIQTETHHSRKSSRLQPQHLSSPFRVWVKYTTVGTSVVLIAWKVAKETWYTPQQLFDIPLISLLRCCNGFPQTVPMYEYDPSLFPSVTSTLMKHQTNLIQQLKELEEQIRPISSLEVCFDTESLYLYDGLLHKSNYTQTTCLGASVQTYICDRPGTGRKRSILTFCHQQISDIQNLKSTRLVPSKATLILVTSFSLRRWKKYALAMNPPFRVHIVSCQQNDLKRNNVDLATLNNLDLVLLTDTFLHSKQAVHEAREFVMKSLHMESMKTTWSTIMWPNHQITPHNSSLLLVTNGTKRDLSFFCPWMIYWKRVVVDEEYLKRYESQFHQLIWYTDHCIMVDPNSASTSTALIVSNSFDYVNRVFHEKDHFCVISLNPNVSIVVEKIPLGDSEQKLIDNYILKPEDMKIITIELPSLSGKISNHSTIEQALYDQRKISRDVIQNTEQVIYQYECSLQDRLQRVSNITHKKRKIEQANQWITARQQTLDYFCSNIDKTQDTCGMCMNDHADIIFDCGHWSCLRCAEVYLLRKDVCPWCQKKLHQGYRICHPRLKWSGGNKIKSMIQWMQEFHTLNNLTNQNGTLILIPVVSINVLEYLNHVLKNIYNLQLTNLSDETDAAKRKLQSHSFDSCRQRPHLGTSLRCILLHLPLLYQASKSNLMEKYLKLLSQSQAIVCLEEIDEVSQRQVLSLVSNTRFVSHPIILVHFV